MTQTHQNKQDSFPIYLAEIILCTGFSLASVQMWVSHNDDRMFLFALCFMVLAILAGDGMIKSANEKI